MSQCDRDLGQTALGSRYTRACLAPAREGRRRRRLSFWMRNSDHYSFGDKPGITTYSILVSANHVQYPSSVAVSLCRMEAADLEVTVSVLSDTPETSRPLHFVFCTPFHLFSPLILIFLTCYMWTSQRCVLSRLGSTLFSTFGYQGCFGGVWLTSLFQ